MQSPVTATKNQASVKQLEPRQITTPLDHLQNNLLTWPGHDHHIRWQPGMRLQHLFESRCDALVAAGQHHHLAVDSGDEQWTYPQLDRRANQFAHYLSSQGIGNGDVVALLFDKSVFSYIAMLAVLKIHAAYVPLDPAFPQERIEFITADAGAKAILCISSYATQATVNGLPCFCLDTPDTTLEALPDTRLTTKEIRGDEHQLCYIIYTSGSTGKPKGVPIDQASICNFIQVATETYGYKPSDRVYQGLTLAFDFAVEEIWVPLAVGATLIPNQSGASLLGDDLADFLHRNTITAMCCVPTLLATVDADLPDLRLIIVSGEACPQDLIQRWHSPTRTILNAYGPTETTVTATIAFSTPDSPVSIGKPLPTYTVVILSPNEERVLPFGEEGEIAIAGIGVAKGYLNREEQTQRAFIKDFIGIPNNPTGRIYRSGDLGCITPDGNIEYRGRIDLQVKIRGYRIELTEIESVLLSHPDIAQAVVDVHEPMPGVKELVAWYTPTLSGNSLEIDTLLDHLRNALPDYMVPTWFEQLDTMPMLASDKADRKRLPKPQGSRMQLDNHEKIAPSEGTEKQLADILCNTLQLDEVSANDHFFDHLGANSLIMAQYTTALRRELSLNSIAMRDIYAHPSIQALARLIDSPTALSEPVIHDTKGHHASLLAYTLTGLAQYTTGILLSIIASIVLWESSHWIFNADSHLNGLLRAFSFSLATLIASIALPIVAKWLLIGRFKPESFPVWSIKYYRFWLVKSLIKANPIQLFSGSPLYIAFYKALGAKISWDANIQTTDLAVTTDLTTIGANSVLAPASVLTGYRVESGIVTLGSHFIGEDVYIGSNSVLDINCHIEDRCELAHASSVAQSQRLESGISYHGVPAQPADCLYRPIEIEAAPSTKRKIIYSSIATLPVMILGTFFLWLPYALLNDSQQPQQLSNAVINSTRTPVIFDILNILLITSAFFIIGIVVGLVFIAIIPKILNLGIEPGKRYPLYGWKYALQGALRTYSYSKFYNYLFGDSSFIVYYLKLTGYRFQKIVQTGSNFGLDQSHDNPFLCNIGEGAMVSDGISIVNTYYGTGSFRSDPATLGKHSFFGNALVWPANAKVGDNCLIGTKTLVPTSGEMRKNTGLLGSPSFEIPRSVQRDQAFDRYKDPAILKTRLALKNRHNLITMALFLIVGFIALFIEACLIWFTHPLIERFGVFYISGLLLFSSLWVLPYFILIDRAALAFKSLTPKYCSIYDEYFWSHERYWKLGAFTEPLIAALNGTPFKSWALRLLGVKVGKRLYDESGGCCDHTLITIGDHVTLNRHAFIQPHSLEDGSFKSDRINIKNDTTIGNTAFIHYGTTIEENTLIEPDAFVMKGESTGEQRIWAGNPARITLIKNQE